MQAVVVRASVIRSVEQPFAMMKSFTGSRPPLAVDSLVRREARLPHLRIDVEG